MGTADSVSFGSNWFRIRMQHFEMQRNTLCIFGSSGSRKQAKLAYIHGLSQLNWSGSVISFNQLAWYSIIVSSVRWGTRNIMLSSGEFERQ